MPINMSLLKIIIIKENKNTLHLITNVEWLLTLVYPNDPAKKRDEARTYFA